MVVGGAGDVAWLRIGWVAGCDECDAVVAVIACRHVLQIWQWMTVPHEAVGSDGLAYTLWVR